MKRPKKSPDETGLMLITRQKRDFLNAHISGPKEIGGPPHTAQIDKVS